ncbi:LysR family transcriptional regulator [Acetobacter sp. TBRC 12305]|uniref:LysR family transcriptional regulator n=1 Tax=Acetobacter garciniae TaxID=2817435 RepID=A0A939HMT4_9PROT|nr:LysR family transcriptional regulator [Acetobacter garciniae]MBO1324539.1 LysR family transcriptional regulator [Acetobacter garciniae]MBX0344228.1 LysR family transcriptional regulator [Acetobacter garciniae]
MTDGVTGEKTEAPPGRTPPAGTPKGGATGRVRLTLRVDVDGRAALGHGKIRLLEHLAQTGSISAAGRAMGMSYRRTWLLVDSLNKLFAQPLVVTRPGGGGGAGLTEAGQQVIALYRGVERQTAELAADSLARIEALLAPPEACPEKTVPQ